LLEDRLLYARSAIADQPTGADPLPQRSDATFYLRHSNTLGTADEIMEAPIGSAPTAGGFPFEGQRDPVASRNRTRLLTCTEPRMSIN